MGEFLMVAGPSVAGFLWLTVFGLIGYELVDIAKDVIRY